MFIQQQGNSNAQTRIIWLHGWGRNHNALLQLSNLFATDAENFLLDLPGFGQSDVPSEVWGSKEYSSAVIDWLQTLPSKKTYVVGHSFGGRIAIQMANSLNANLAGIILIAGAGLRRNRSYFFILKALILKTISKVLRYLDQNFNLNLKEKFSKHFGSRDYKAISGIMRNILVKTINEDLSDIASNITIPTLLIYGSNDNETPVEFGQRYHSLIKGSAFYELPGFDHSTILSSGRHQVYNLMNNFLLKEE